MYNVKVYKLDNFYIIKVKEKMLTPLFEYISKYITPISKHKNRNLFDDMFYEFILKNSIYNKADNKTIIFTKECLSCSYNNFDLNKFKQMSLIDTFIEMNIVIDDYIDSHILYIIRS